MKNRASLVLMEQLVMILVFALSAALCLRLFVAADSLSRETELQDQAVVLAQNGAETMKACHGSFSEAAQLLGGNFSGGSLTVRYEGLNLKITPEAPETPGLGMAEITVTDPQTGKTLFSLTAAWQEVG